MNGRRERSATGAWAGPARTERGSRDAWELLIDQQLTECVNGRSRHASRATVRPRGLRAATVTSHLELDN